MYVLCASCIFVSEQSSKQKLNLFQVNDTIMLDIETGKPKEFVKFELGNICMVTGGANNG